MTACIARNTEREWELAIGDTVRTSYETSHGEFGNKQPVGLSKWGYVITAMKAVRNSQSGVILTCRCVAPDCPMPIVGSLDGAWWERIE